MKTKFYNLPRDVKIKILKLLALKDLGAAGRVNKHWYSLYKDDDLWKDCYSELESSLIATSRRAYCYFFKPHENNKSYLFRYSELKRFLLDQLSSYKAIKYYEQKGEFFYIFSGLYEASLAYYLTGQFDMALKIIEESIDRQIESHYDKWTDKFEETSSVPEREYHLRAEINTALGKYSLAVSDYPATREGFEKKAYAYYRLNQTKEALQACVAAIICYANENKKFFDLKSDYHLKMEAFMSQILAKKRTAFGKSSMIFFRSTTPSDTLKCNMINRGPKPVTFHDYL